SQHNQRVRTGKLGNLLAVALLLAVGLVLLPRTAQAHGGDHAGQHQHQRGADEQYRANANSSNGSQLHDRSAVRLPFAVLATHCPGGSGSTCCCHDEAAVVSVPLSLAAVARSVLLVSLSSRDHV